MLTSFIRQKSSENDKFGLEKSVSDEMLEALKPGDKADASNNEPVFSGFSVIDRPYDNAPPTPLNSALSRIRHLSISLERVTILPDSLLGYGGYGDVRMARLDDPKEGTRLVAVKALRPIGDSQERERIAVRLVREIDLWAKLRHPNILPLIGFHLQSDHTVAWLVSHRCSKGNALEYLKEAKPDKAHRAKLISDTAKGLQYLHEFEPPIYHGDLKATNVLITDEARAVLCDFGLAKVMEEQTGLTTTTSLKGSTRYLSPEIAFETSGRTPKSDIWAWGCLILEIMAERIPYQDVKQDGRVFIKLHERELPVDLSQLRLPHHIIKVMQDCWSFDPEKRPHVSSCVQMIEDSYRRLSRSGKDLLLTAIVKDHPLHTVEQSLAPKIPQHLPGSVVLGAHWLPASNADKLRHVYPTSQTGQPIAPHLRQPAQQLLVTQLQNTSPLLNRHPLPAHLPLRVTSILPVGIEPSAAPGLRSSGNVFENAFLNSLRGTAGAAATAAPNGSRTIGDGHAGSGSGTFADLPFPVPSGRNVTSASSSNLLIAAPAQNDTQTPSSMSSARWPPLHQASSSAASPSQSIETVWLEMLLGTNSIAPPTTEPAHNDEPLKLGTNRHLHSSWHNPNGPLYQEASPLNRLPIPGGAPVVSSFQKRPWSGSAATTGAGLDNMDSDEGDKQGEGVKKRRKQ